MKLSEFRELLDRLKSTNSRSEKKELIRHIEDPAAISLLAGTEFDDAGLGKTTVKSVAENVFPDVQDSPTLSDGLQEWDESDFLMGLHPTGDDYPPYDFELEVLRSDMSDLSILSGHDMENHLEALFESYLYPSVLSFAILNDEAIGAGNSTIAKAHDLKDSLPFYDGVHEAFEDDNPLTSPESGRPFDPMLAKSESSLPEDLSDWWGQVKLDGYRCIIHVTPTGVSAFSRRQNDITESLPELREIDWPDGDYIFDAEVIAEDGTYNSTSERIGRKAENVDRDVEMNFALFDVIVLDGDDLSERPYKDRYGGLNVASRSINDDRVSVLQVISNIEEAKAKGQEHEGVIWKDPDAEYEFGKRSSSWVKEKNTEETVDVVAADFIEGDGRLTGTLGKIVLMSADGAPVGRTGSGFTDQQRDEVWQNQDHYANETLEVSGEAFQEGIRFPIFQRWRIDDGEPDSIERIREILPEP